MKNKQKIINYALNMLSANFDDMAEEDLGMTEEELQKELQEIKSEKCMLYFEEREGSKGNYAFLGDEDVHEGIPYEG